MSAANRFAELAPAHIQRLVAYDPGYEPSEIRARLGLAEIIELGSNENSFGPCAAVQALLQKPDLKGFRYPDAAGGVLKTALSAHYGLPTAHFTLGNGTHELLTLIAETFCAPGDEVVHAQYGFAVYRLAALGAGAAPVMASATRESRLGVTSKPEEPPALASESNKHLNVSPNAMLAAVTAKTKLMYLANPNNPTGTMWSISQLRELLTALPSHVLFVLDEAYIEYVSSPEVLGSLALLAEFPRLIIARTFSKAYALASLRVGYTIAHPDFAQMLERTRLSFNVNLLALRAAALAIADQAHIEAVRGHCQLQRSELCEQLNALGLEVLPSECNFVLVHFARDAAPIEHALLQQGVIVRPMRGYGLPEHLRITVGNAHENKRLITALRHVLAA